MTVPCQNADTPLSVSPFWITPRNSTPTKVPSNPPSPPRMLMPPMSTAAMTASIWLGSTMGTAAVSLPSCWMAPSA